MTLGTREEGDLLLAVEENGETLRMAHETAGKRLRLTHCLMHASCSKLKLDGVRLVETDKQSFTWKRLLGLRRPELLTRRLPREEKYY